MEKGMRMVRFILLCCLLVLPGIDLSSQQVSQCYMENGKIILRVPPDFNESQLDGLLKDFNLNREEFHKALVSNNWEFFTKAGWKIKSHRKKGITLSRSLDAGSMYSDWVWSMLEGRDSVRIAEPGVPYMYKPYGINSFSGKPGVRKLNDSTALFFIPGEVPAKEVFLSGSFNNWATREDQLSKTDSGWVIVKHIHPGKHLYKFILDGRWTEDKTNQLQESDGYLGKNSVYYHTNKTFRLNGFTDRKVFYLSGTFCGWKENEIPMKKVEDGWTVELYLLDGTYEYKFHSDKFWIEDQQNPDKTDDLAGGFNSVLIKGTPAQFKLTGFEQAQQVLVTGSFLNWNPQGIDMKQNNGNWEASYVPGPGIHFYKFIVDGKWIVDPQNPDSVWDDSGNLNSMLMHEPNYTFRLKGHLDAQKVILAGTFNNWDEENFRMRRDEQGWWFPVYLTPGKVQYKFIVDGKWITDPSNPIWEENEHKTGNSILWFKP